MKDDTAANGFPVLCQMISLSGTVSRIRGNWQAFALRRKIETSVGVFLHAVVSIHLDPTNSVGAVMSYYLK